MGKASSASKRKYNKKAYDTLAVNVKKGEKEKLKEHAASKGESLNGFVNRAIKQALESDKDTE